MKAYLLLLLVLPIVTPWDPFAGYYNKADKILKNMTLEQKVGQMFFPDFVRANEDEDIKNYYPGGFTFFADPFEEEDEPLLANIEHIQNLSKELTGLPLGLAVDEEGGIVNRVSKYKRKEPFPAPQKIYNESGIDGILKIDKEKRALLKKYGMNVNYAPVADVSYNSSDYIYSRTLGKDAKKTADYIGSDVKGYVEEKFTCTVKHFPGYGNNINTHEDVAYDTRPYSTFENEDFLPFKAAIDELIPMIMVAHNIVTCKDKKLPASISKTWHDILRNELKYEGLILTDDLSMEAIKKYSGDYSPAILAVIAGNNILLTGDIKEHYPAVLEAVKNNTIKEETINNAAKKVIAWKLKYLLNEKPEEENPPETWVLILIVLLVIAISLSAFAIVRMLEKKVYTVDKGVKLVGSDA